jgi:molybdopterin-guanine dinucleotide biosynthesis protein A
MRLTGFVLAGGKSTRMGRDKALLDWRGQTLLEHMMGLLSVVASPVQVVGRDQLPDRLPGLGPLSGIATALETSQTDANICVAVDLPFLTHDFLKYLRSRIETSNHAILACKIGSHFPLCIGVQKSVLPEVQTRLSGNDLSVRSLIEATDSETFDWPDVSIFRNINTPGDYLNNSGTSP